MQKSPTEPESAIATTEHILKKRNYPRRPAYLLAALEDVAARLGGVPEPAKRLLLDYFGMEKIPAEVTETLCHRHGEASKSVVVCAGPICSQSGSDEIARELAALSGVSLERQHCFGLCDQAPCASVNGRMIAPATGESMIEALKGCSE